MAEFELNGHSYRSTRIDARRSFHVARRLQPVLISFKDIQIKNEVDENGQVKLDEKGNPIPILDLDSLQPTMEAVAKMSDEDVDYIIDECMKACSRGTQGSDGAITGWMPTWNAAAKRPQFEDINMVEMLQLCRYVITESMQDFFSGPLSL